MEETACHVSGNDRAGVMSHTLKNRRSWLGHVRCRGRPVPAARGGASDTNFQPPALRRRSGPPPRTQPSLRGQECSLLCVPIIAQVAISLQVKMQFNCFSFSYHVCAKVHVCANWRRFRARRPISPVHQRFRLWLWKRLLTTVRLDRFSSIAWSLTG